VADARLFPDRPSAPGGSMNTDCRNVRNLLPMALLGEAESEATARIERHLSECAECRAESDRHSSLLGTLSATEVPDPGQAYWSTFLPRLRERISKEPVMAELPAKRREWAVAAAVALFLLGAAGVLTLKPSPRERSRMTLSFLATRTSPDTLRQALDEVLPGSEPMQPVGTGRALEVPGFVELQRALDSLVPPEEGDPASVADDLSPQARAWLLKALMPDRV
jgi:hypothetical protein